jgi:hypothetical protein
MFRAIRIRLIEEPDKGSIAAQRGADRGRAPGNAEAPDKGSIAAQRGADRGRAPGNAEAPGESER